MAAEAGNTQAAKHGPSRVGAQSLTQHTLCRYNTGYNSISKVQGKQRMTAVD